MQSRSNPAERGGPRERVTVGRGHRARANLVASDRPDPSRTSGPGERIESVVGGLVRPADTGRRGGAEGPAQRGQHLQRETDRIHGALTVLGRGEPAAPDQRDEHGVVIDERGYILTNQHVVDKVQGIEVLLADGLRYTGRVVQQDPIMDIALLKIDAPP